MAGTAPEMNPYEIPKSIGTLCLMEKDFASDPGHFTALYLLYRLVGEACPECGKAIEANR